MRFQSRVLGAAASFLGSALADSGNVCTTSTLAAYDYEVTPDTGFTLYWAVDTVAEEITFKAVYEGVGWVGVGFSATGAMVPGDAVIGLPDDGTPLEYDMTSESLTGVTENANQEVSGATITQTASSTTLTFTRPLAPSDSSKTTLSAIVGDASYILWARGLTNSLSYHGSNRGTIALSDLFCTTELTSGGSTVATAAAGCVSSDPDYTYEVSPKSELTLSWRVEGDTVAVKAVYQGTGWLAIGFSSDGNMAGSDAVVALPTSATVLEYDMDNHNTPVESAQQEITGTSIVQTGGVTTMTFTRPLAPVGDGKEVLSTAAPTIWLYAWGGGDVFVEHTVDGGFSLSLDSCTLGAVGGGTENIEYAHGWLMVVSWTFFFPMGILFARFSSSFKDVGFPAHRVMQSLGTVVAIAGFVVAIVFTADNGASHFDNNHAKGGLVLTAWLMLQVVAAIFRPGKPAPGSVVQDDMGNMEPAPDSKVRLVWSTLHKASGYVVVIWAVLQCFGGINLVSVKNVWTLLYLILVMVMAGAFVILQGFACCKSKSSSPVDYSGPPPGSAARTGTA